MKPILTLIILFCTIGSFAQTVSISSKNKIIVNDKLSGNVILTLASEKLDEFKWNGYAGKVLSFKVTKRNYKDLRLLFNYTANDYINDTSRLNRDIKQLKFSKNQEIAKLALVILDIPDPDGMISIKIAKRIDGTEFNIKNLTPYEAASLIASYIREEVAPNALKKAFIELEIIKKDEIRIIEWYIKIMSISVLVENIQAFESDIASKYNLLFEASKRYTTPNWDHPIGERFALQVKYQLTLEATYSFGIKYKYLGNKLISDSKLQRPWGFRLTNYWKDLSGSGWYVPLAYSQSPFLYTKAESADTVFKSEGYSGFKHIDILLGYNLRLLGNKKVGVFGNLELGARAAFIENSKYLFINNKISDVQKLSSFNYDQTSAILNIGAMIDFRFLQINFKHSNTIANRGEGKKDRRLNAKYYQAGIQVPIGKSYRFIPK